MKQLSARWRLPLWTLIIPALLITAWLGMRGINRDLIWLDEFLTRKFTIGITGETQDFLLMVGNAVKDGVWPPLYLILYYLWAAPVGWSLFMGRYLSLVFGLLTVAFAYRLGRTLFSPAAGVFAAYTFATSAFIGYYNHEMRGYSLYALAVVLTLWTYWRLVSSLKPRKEIPRPIRRLFQLGLFLLLYSHYVAAAFFMVLGLYHVLFQRRSPNFRWILGRFFMAFVLYVPWVLVMLAGILYEAQAASLRSLGLEKIITSILYGFSEGMPLLMVGVLVYVGLFVQRTRAAHKRKSGDETAIYTGRREVIFLFFLAGVTLVVALVMDNRISFLLHVRHILFLAVIAAILIALVMADLWQRFAPAALAMLALWAGAGIIHSLSNDFMNSLPGQVSSIPVSLEQTYLQLESSCFAPDDVVVFSVDKPANQGEWVHGDTLQMSLPPHAFKTTMLGYMVPVQYNLNLIVPAGTYPERLDAMVRDAPTAWVFTLQDRPASSQTPEFESLMREKYAYCGIFTQNAETTVYAYHNSSTLTCGGKTIPLPPCDVGLITGYEAAK